MSKAGKRKLKKEVVYVLAGILALLCIIAVILIYTHMNRFEYTKSLNEIVITVNDTNISLKELTYYIMQVEKTGNEYAKAYNPDNPTEYWNIYMNNATESGYVTDLAKEAAIDYCIRDNIYAIEAMNMGMELTAEEMSDIAYDAQMAYELMTHKQRMMSELTAEDFELIMTKEQLAYKYMAYLAENDKDGVLAAVVLKYDVDGSYYETLKITYEIFINYDILDYVKVGYVTIN